MSMEKFVEKKMTAIEDAIMEFVKKNHNVKLMVKDNIEQLFIDGKCVLSIDNDKYDIKTMNE